MSKMNMNGNNNDTNYRYKMPTFKVRVAGKGNGIFTLFDNIDAISHAINHPVEVIMKYIANVTGSNYIQERGTITGALTTDALNEIIIEYNKHLVFCAECEIPETVPTLSSNKKNAKLIFCCSACKHTIEAKSVNKRIDKGIDIIIKYLKAGGEWKIHKGTCVKQDKKSDSEENSDDNSDDDSDDNNDSEDENENPFDSL